LVVRTGYGGQDMDDKKPKELSPEELTKNRKLKATWTTGNPEPDLSDPKKRAAFVAGWCAAFAPSVDPKELLVFVDKQEDLDVAIEGDMDSSVTRMRLEKIATEIAAETLLNIERDLIEGHTSSKLPTWTAPENFCPRCRSRGKPWPGDNPQCAFSNEQQVFDTDNWNCATMNELREIVEPICWDGKVEPIMPFWGCRREDTSIGVIWLPGGTAEDGWLVMTWYKRRGRTGRAMIMVDDEEPQVLTLQQAERLLAQYEETE
jgi:hypothetical protein